MQASASLLMRRGGLAALGAGRLGAPLAAGAAAFASEAAAADGKGKAKDPADAFIFQEKCKGTRQVSKDAEDLKERLRKSNFGAPRKGRTGALGAAAPSADPTATGGAHQQKGALHTCAAASWAAQGGGPSAEDAAQELVEKGSKRMMQSDDGREELRQGSFDLDKTAERILEEGQKEASPEASQMASQKEVQEGVKSRVVSGSQTS